MDSAIIAAVAAVGSSTILVVIGQRVGPLSRL